jgi:bacterial/archaeal transporter family-2 protein
MDRFGPVVLAMTGGGLIAAQAPINARLKLVVGSPLLAAAVSFAVGTLLLAVAVLLTNAQGGVTALGGGPWWAYLGGFCGAVLVTATLIAAPRLGVTSTFVAVIVGQVAIAAVIDRFGLFGVAARGLTPTRVVAIILLALSLVLLLRN